MTITHALVNFAAFTTAAELSDLIVSTNTVAAELTAKILHLPKAKAATKFNEATGETFDPSITTRANIEGWVNAMSEGCYARLAEIEEEAADLAPIPELTNAEKIATLLAELAADSTPKAAKKNIRAKLRRLGYYRSMFAKAQAADVAEGSPSQPQDATDDQAEDDTSSIDADEEAYQEKKAASEYENDR